MLEVLDCGEAEHSEQLPSSFGLSLLPLGKHLHVLTNGANSIDQMVLRCGLGWLHSLLFSNLVKKSLCGCISIKTFHSSWELGHFITLVDYKCIFNIRVIDNSIGVVNHVGEAKDIGRLTWVIIGTSESINVAL